MMKRTKSFTNNENILYLIATPIGNLGEFCDRAKEIVSSCDIVAAEDTRNSKSLLEKFSIKKEMFSLREHNEQEASEFLIQQIKSGKKVVYMSDAGYPGISDPGTILVKKAIENDIPVSTINGSSAFLNALVSSGIETNHFYFHGFLSPKENECKSELEQLKNKTETLIFYESPHRIKKTLTNLFAVLGNRNATIGRELTKLNEEFIRGGLEELSQIDESSLIGEMVIIVEGNKQEVTFDEKAIKERILFFTSKGLSKKDSIEIVAEEFKINKNIVYKIAID